jgi:hypothetical protein
MRDDAQPRLGDAELRERVAAALGVHDHAVAAVEERLPEVGLRGRAPRDDVVRGEDDGRARPKEPAVCLRRAEPLHVQNVRPERGEARHAEGVLEGLQDEPGVRAAHARGERIEPLVRLVSVRRGNGSEAEARGHELHVGSRACERRGEVPVVRRGVGGRVGKDDAHGQER